jgi:ABC-type transporter Mla subunit MlaD
MTDRNAFKAGLFILISLAAIVGIIIGIKGLGALALPHNQYIATFSLKDNVGGLRVGDDVRVGGVKLGTVRDIEFVPLESGREPAIRVKFRLPRYVGLTQDARVVVESTVTGTSNLNIENIKPGQTPLADGGEIKGYPSGLSTLFASLGEVAPDVKGIVGDVRTSTVPKVNAAFDEYKGLASDLRAKVEPAYKKYENVADRGSEALSQVRDVFGESKTDFKTTVANLSSATGTVKDKIGPILDKLDGGLVKAQESLDKINATLDEVKKSADNARDISANVRGILSNNRTRIEEMIASLKVTGDNLKGASAEIRRSPWRLLYKPGAGDMANLNLFDSAREFAEGANDLSDAATALRDALNNPAMDEREIAALVQKLNQSFEKFGKMEAELWKQVRE